MHKLIFGLLILITSPALLRAQTENPADPIMASYSKVIPHFPDLHMGGQFSPPHRSVNETSFYLDNGFEQGKLVISGFEFQEVPLDYNVWYDILVTINPIHRQYTLLNHLKIDQFTLDPFLSERKMSPVTITIKTVFIGRSSRMKSGCFVSIGKN